MDFLLFGHIITLFSPDNKVVPVLEYFFMVSRYGHYSHSGGLPFSLKRNLPASLLSARAAGIHTGFICGPPNEIF